MTATSYTIWAFWTYLGVEYQQKTYIPHKFIDSYHLLTIKS